MRRTLRLAALLAATLAAGCGGGGDLTGEADVPDGYTTFEGAGVSFAHPEGWRVQERSARGRPGGGDRAARPHPRRRTG